MLESFFTALAFVSLLMSEPGLGTKNGSRTGQSHRHARKNGKLVFLEHGKEKAQPIPIVVGQTVRWENKDTDPHLVSNQAVSGKPLFDTGVIEPASTRRSCSISICTSGRGESRRMWSR